MKKLTDDELAWLENHAKEDEFFKSLLAHYSLKSYLTPNQYYWLNLFTEHSNSEFIKENKTNLTTTITKIPCPHCNFLCSPQIKYCVKCGEPLPKLEKISETKELSHFALLDENYLEKNIIHSLEKLTNKELPCKECFEVSSRCYMKEADQITALNLYKCGLNKFPEELLKLTSLKYLALRRNSISTLTKQIGFMTNLEYLDLRINKLQKLPDSIGLLSNLKTLNLSSNQLLKIPESIGNLKSLKILNLQNNKLKKIPVSILQLDNLEKLNIKANFWISNQDTIDSLKEKGVKVLQ
jgi:Leucine-rich repeat (LRR) protein